jgi:glycosyltransferase involved in cell wall biosynthesis
MAPYALLARLPQPEGVRVLDQHNAVYRVPERLAAADRTGGLVPRLKRAFLGLEARKLAAFEQAVCARFDHVVWVTDEDRRAVAGRRRAETVIPICVSPQDTPPLARRPDAARITFLGGLHWPPNAEGVRWFAAEVFPRIRSAVPQACLTVIGRNPPAGLGGPGVDVTGYLDDPAPYLAETAVFIVPLHAGGGMRVKILDAWAWGLPVVATTIGAEGLAYQDGHDLLIADQPEALAAAVTRVLREPALGARLSEGGRRTVLEKYDWRRVYPAWDDIYPA